MSTEDEQAKLKREFDRIFNEGRDPEGERRRTQTAEDRFRDAFSDFTGRAGPRWGYFIGDDENSISLTTEFPVIEEILNELGYPIREICDDRCLDFVQNVREHNKYQNKIIQKFVDNNGMPSMRR